MNNSQLDVDKYLDNVDSTLKHVSNLTDDMKALTYKTSKLRDCGDEVVRTLIDFIEKDKPTDLNNQQFNQNLQQFAQCLSIVEDHRDSQIERLNSKIINGFSQFNEFLKYTKTELKSTSAYYNKEISKLKKAQSSSSNRNPVFKYSNRQPNSEFFSLELKSLQKELVNLTTKFDSEKIKTVQDILKEFTLIQLSFCSQAMQVYTNAYKCLITPDKDHVFPLENKLEQMSKDLYKPNFIEDLTSHLDQSSSQGSTIPVSGSRQKRLDTSFLSSSRSKSTNNTSDLYKHSQNFNNSNNSSLSKQIKNSTLLDDTYLFEKENDGAESNEDSADSISQSTTDEDYLKREKEKFLFFYNETEL